MGLKGSCFLLPSTAKGRLIGINWNAKTDWDEKKGSLLEAGEINEPDLRVEIIIMVIVGFTELLSSTTQTNKLSNHSRRRFTSCVLCRVLRVEPRPWAPNEGRELSVRPGNSLTVPSSVIKGRRGGSVPLNGGIKAAPCLRSYFDEPKAFGKDAKPQNLFQKMRWKFPQID